MLGIDKDSKEEKAKADEVSSPDASKKAFREQKKDTKDELKKAKKEREEYLDGWKRAKADLINYKRDELKRLEQVVHFANEEMISDIITVLDSFELAIASMEKDNPAEKGVYMIKSKLQDVLKKRGVSKIEVNEGDKFDPQYHEAITTIEGEGRSDTISEEVETGYMLYDKVIRAAKVKVYK